MSAVVGKPVGETVKIIHIVDGLNIAHPGQCLGVASKDEGVANLCAVEPRFRNIETALTGHLLQDFIEGHDAVEGLTRCINPETMLQYTHQVFPITV